jgi:hypothetical protein
MRRRQSMFDRIGKRLSLTAALAALSLLVAAAPASAAPSVSPTITGLLGTNGWYRGINGANYVYLRWNYHDDPSVDHTLGCEPVYRVDGPTAGRTLTCTAYLIDGGTISWSRTIKIDANAPTGVAASLSRGPDFNGWYNHPLGVTWHGSDAMSGIASCSAIIYAGPDRAATRIAGGCTDKAGNPALAPVPINYDATAPVLSKLTVTSKARSDLVRWKSSSPSDTVVIQRWARGNKQPAAGRGIVFQGTGEAFTDRKIRSSVEYTYAVQTIDQAGNASRKVSVLAFPKVLTLGKKTPYTPRAAPNPILRWGRPRGATYYHVQLFRGSKRIYATWPPKNQLGLPSAWRWSGHRYRLAPGRYRWYVWAGIGKRSFARYRAVGSAQFIIPR